MKTKHSVMSVGAVLFAVGCGAASAEDFTIGETPKDESQAAVLKAPTASRTRCTAECECKEGEFCQAEPGTCRTESGICRPKPETCDHTYAPVCGCDGHTYPNECVASLYGVSVRSRGECSRSGEVDVTASDERVVRKRLEAHRIQIPSDDIFFCYGFNETVNQCFLYAGTEEFCDTVLPCWTAPQGSSDAVYTRFSPEADTFCQGWDEISNECQTYFGTKEMCASLEPCGSAFNPPTAVAIEVPDPHFCYGFDEETNECYLYYGSKAMCDSLLPCW